MNCFRKIKAFLVHPQGVMTVVVLMYLVKVAAKLTIGNKIHSPMITGDGWHNASDIVEALIVMAMVGIASLKETSDYPFGRKNAEYIAALAIGLGLFAVAVNLFTKSAIGLLSLAPAIDASVREKISLPTHEPLIIGGEYFPWVIGVTGTSVILSLLVGRYQISIGKKSGRSSVVADGEETLSDGRVETAVCAGILGEYLFKTPWLEYLFGLTVMILIIKTGSELFLRGWRGLLHRSIGLEHEKTISELAKQTHGVIDMAQIKTFMEGNKVVVILKALTRTNIETHHDIKHAVCAKMRAYLKQSDFVDWEFFVRFDTPSPKHHRHAYAVVVNQGVIVMAATLAKATHLLICDIEHDDVKKETEEANPTTLEETIAFLKHKRVSTVLTWSTDEAEQEALIANKLEHEEVPSHHLETLGL